MPGSGAATAGTSRQPGPASCLLWLQAQPYKDFSVGSAQNSALSLPAERDVTHSSLQAPAAPGQVGFGKGIAVGVLVLVAGV